VIRVSIKIATPGKKAQFNEHAKSCTFRASRFVLRLFKMKPDYQIQLNCPPRWQHCEPLWRWEPPAFTDFDLWYVGAGKGCLRFADQDWQITKNQCFVLTPGTKLLGAQDESQRLSVFYVHFEWLQEAPFSFPSGVIDVRDWGHFEDMSHRAERDYARGHLLGKVQSTAWVRQMLLHLIAEQTLPPPSIADAALEQIIAAMRQAPGKWHSVPELAAQIHLSPSQFTRRFYTVTGMSPRHFQIRTRLERARQLLEESEMTLQHIAFALGYQDHYFFARQYKQWMGETPGKTRLMARDKHTR